MTALSSNSKHKIGIFGGTFNPIHNEHLFIADQVCEYLGLEKVYLMPDYIPPHIDEKHAIDADLRVDMIKLAIQGNNNLDIELSEINRKGKSYTYETMLELCRKYPNNEYYFIIGGDMVDYLPKWHRIDDLLNLVNFVGVRRANYVPKTDYPVTWVDVPEIDISSTMIRNKLSRNQSVRYLVPENVNVYIKEHSIYR
ncbi:nicotinate-nucleotide adenylyltransferase [Apilactobacillus ozensis]|uniref:Probable nicotinate-nucleotide adenylyltransferase n=1 Tax=Apilactobacillus ozensis DSM 23829 = JCM 17196 TaxID=1423781 RepID=A0A0R2AMM3_9LACO|nr:nicotinate-nucleotide adenylyltransferase [Apilactobacillus ozensis]KRM68119.1 nicotinate-nucleotide adenylyltransferase [Apilactobacillus ozensis DSM 23829 = JCM 17196]MCK8606622.1 nicotinate-nucleotide adenylyltransferase [Apilactobacillus ozensis]